jgi:hypothetical protein
MTLVASLLFATALAASLAVIYLTLLHGMPRIEEVIETEFAPVVKAERRISFGEVKGRRSADIIAFPRKFVDEPVCRLAA